jgi:hypothetical protein
MPTSAYPATTSLDGLRCLGDAPGQDLYLCAPKGLARSDGRRRPIERTMSQYVVLVSDEARATRPSLCPPCP